MLVVVASDKYTFVPVLGALSVSSKRGNAQVRTNKEVWEAPKYLLLLIRVCVVECWFKTLADKRVDLCCEARPKPASHLQPSPGRMLCPFDQSSASSTIESNTLGLSNDAPSISLKV